MNSIVYQLNDHLYLNITNRCHNHCDFCIKFLTKVFHGKYPLYLDREPAADEVIAAVGDPKRYKEVVFCGYGEALIRLDEVKGVARALKPTGVPLRIDTDGLANLFYKRNILPELKGLIDTLSVSLNAENAELYDALCHPVFGKDAYGAVLDFIRESKKYIPRVIASVVDLPEIDKDKCRQIAADLGVEFRVRKYYQEKYPES